jgi:flagellar protein FlbD
MIAVTRFNGSVVYVNATLIETVEGTPDTLISLINGKKLIVRESVEEVKQRIESFYQKTGLIAVQLHQNAEGQDVS